MLGGPSEMLLSVLKEEEGVVDSALLPPPAYPFPCEPPTMRLLYPESWLLLHVESSLLPPLYTGL